MGMSGKKQSCRWRHWLLRLCLAILGPLIIFGLMEAGLRLGGYGYPTGLFVSLDGKGLYRTNDKFGRRFFPRKQAREPYRCVLSPKPGDAIRIFVLGSSSAMGYPDPSFAFGRILEVMLRERYQGVQFEVINAAMTAINSHVVLEIARDCAAQEPDLFIVYMGNNEVVGPYGPGTIFQKWLPSASLIRAAVFVKSLRTGQLFAEGVDRLHPDSKDSRRWSGMEAFLNNPVSADDHRMSSVYDNFRKNLMDICGVAQSVGSPVILSTVAVNLKDCPPFGSRHRDGLSTEVLQNWQTVYEAGTNLESKGNMREALQKYEEAARIDDRFADLQYRMARCLFAASKVPEAREHFLRARDLDVLRFRADSHINGVIRDVAAVQQSIGVRCADTDKVFWDSAFATGGIPGRALFYEHVHMTFDGNYLLARTMLDEVTAALPRLERLRRNVQIPSRQECAAALALTSWDEFVMAGEMAGMMSRPPFTKQLDHQNRYVVVCSQLEAIKRRATTAEALQSAWKTYETALAKMPGDWQLHDHFGTLAMKCGRPEVASEHRRIVVETLPWRAQAHYDLGLSLQQMGKLPEAMEQYEQGFRVNPDVVEADSNLGAAVTAAREAASAITNCVQALRVSPDDPVTHNNFGNVLRKVGRVKESIWHYEQALRIKPDNATTHYNLAVALAQTGSLPEAIVHYQEAVRLKPDFLPSLNNLAWIRATAVDPKLRDGAEAVRSAEHACQLTGRKQPGLLDTLAVTYAEAGRFPEAVATAEEGIALAKTAKQQALADEIQERVELYRAGKPYREPTRKISVGGE